MQLRQTPSPGVPPWESNMGTMLHLRGEIMGEIRMSCLTSKSHLAFKTFRPIYVTNFHVSAQGVS